MKNKRYFIYAYDELYQGLHGMYNYCFVECSFSDAKEYGYEMSANIIDSYEYIYDAINDEEMTDEERDEAFLDDIAYEIWELCADAPSFEELEKMNLSPEEYIEEFCICEK